MHTVNGQKLNNKNRNPQALRLFLHRCKIRRLDYNNIQLPRRRLEQAIAEGLNENDCLYCGNPLLQEKFRDAVRDHCHITGRFMGVAHNDCNRSYMYFRINPSRLLCHKKRPSTVLLLTQASQTKTTSTPRKSGKPSSARHWETTTIST